MKKIIFRLLLVVFTLSSLLSYAPDPNRNRRVVLSQRFLLSETKAWLAVLPSRPSQKTITAVNNFIRTCKADGNWTLLDRFWLYAQDKQVNVVYSIVNPTSTPCTEVNSPTWTQYQGYTGNGTNMYLNTNYIPSTNGVQYTLNSSSCGVYSRTNSSIAAYDIGATNGTNATAMACKWSDNLAYFSINANTSVSVGVTNSLGLFSSSRVSATSLIGYQNGSNIVSGSPASVSVPTVSCFVLARNVSGVASNFSSRQISIAFVGGGGIDQLKFYNAVQTLKSQIGF